MRPVDIEAWALRVIDAVQGGHANEDSRVELKGELPADSAKAARRIAGHLNAARGDDVLWLIGVDEGTGVIGCHEANVGAWWQQVRVQFDDVPPALTDVVVHGLERPVLAILFDATGAPFVVRNPAHGTRGNVVEREVPWREGTHVRSATRSDLIRLLAPREAQISADVIRALVTAWPERTNQPPELTLDLTVYVTSVVGETVVIPDHLCSAHLEFPDVNVRRELSVELISADAPFTQLSMRQRGERVLTIRQGDAQVIVDGPGFLRIFGRVREEFGPAGPPPFNLAESVRVNVGLRPAGGDRVIRVAAALAYDPRQRPSTTTQPLGEWRYEAPPRTTNPLAGP